MSSFILLFHKIILGTKTDKLNVHAYGKGYSRTSIIYLWIKKMIYKVKILNLTMKKPKKKKLNSTIYLIIGMILFLSGLFLVNYLAWLEWLGWILIIIGSIFIFTKMLKIRKINLFLKKK